MLRRLAIIAATLALTACSDAFYSPTGVSLNRAIDDDRTVPQGLCDDTSAESAQRLIPTCVDTMPWPDDSYDARLRHSYETVTVRSADGGARSKVRMY